MEHFVLALQEHPELAIFLALAMGFLIGKLKIGSFNLGIVVGTLLAGVIIGQLDINVSPTVKSVFFLLFLFTTGYKVGPQFFRGLKKDALPQLAVTVVLCVTCLLSAFFAAKILGYDMGTTAGMLAGAFTESTVIGTASDAINRLSIPDAQKTLLMNNIPVAYAVTYLIGTAFIVWFLPNIGPRLMGVNLKEEGRKLQAKISTAEETEAGVQSAFQTFGVRAYRVTNEKMVNKTIAELEAMPKEARVFITRVRHDGEIVEPDSSTVIHTGDVVAVMTRTELLMARGVEIGPEVDDKALLDFPQEFLDVVITNKALVGKTLRELGASGFARGVFLRKLLKLGEPMPFTVETRIDRGDVVSLVGAKRDVERAAQEMGYADRPAITTDMIFVGLGIFFGGLVGLLTITLGGLPITLTVSGGALVMGLVFGWLRSVRPTFGRIPEPAMWVFDTVGLTVFMAVVGLGAGPSFIAGLQKSGISLVFVGLLVAVLPHLTAILFGRYILKMNPLILLGACSGAGTITAALRAVQDEAQSKLPALGYTVPYALGNIILTAWGPVIVAMMA
ncbi:MAG: aspartate-alanine antiporter [Desulfobacterota bacterium]|jgi:putative transport protein|nr:aspartate-alanine antiporter [Thermodesulfobacteriota bacterium]